MESDWITPLSLDTLEGGTLLEKVAADDSEQLGIELLLDLTIYGLCTPLDLTRAMYYSAGFSYREIAALEGALPADSNSASNRVKQSVYRVRRKIKHYLIG